MDNCKELRLVLDTIYITAGALAVTDVNGDGAPDIFLGARCNVYDYGSIPASYLLINDGKGHFADRTREMAPALSSIGMVTSADWTDLDKDGDPDLLLSLGVGNHYLAGKQWRPVCRPCSERGKRLVEYSESGRYRWRWRS